MIKVNEITLELVIRKYEWALFVEGIGNELGRLCFLFFQREFKDLEGIKEMEYPEIKLDCVRKLQPYIKKRRGL